MTHHGHHGGNGNGATELRERPVGDLVKDLTEQTTKLVRSEIELAKVELTEKGKRAGVGAGMFGGAGFLGFFAFAALTAALIAGLGELVPVWAAALIVAAVYGIVAGVLALSGKKKVAEATPAAPQEAIASAKRDVETVKQHAKGTPA